MIDINEKDFLHFLPEVDDMINRSKCMMDINGKHLLHVLVEVPVDVHTHLNRLLFVDLANGNRI